MGKVIGLGGVFIKANDPKALAEWYEKYLGINFKGQAYVDLPFVDEEGKPTAGSNVLSFFKMDSGYFAPSEKATMLNLRVSGLLEWIEELRSAGVAVIGEPLNEDYGKFAWILDPEGNKIELWEP